MGFLLKIAFRNVLRHKRRTVLTSILIASGLAVLILYDGLVIGMSDTMVRNATETFLGHAQIHAPNFRDDQDIDQVIQKPLEVQKILADDPNVEAVSPRTLTLGMISSAGNVSSITIYGVEPESEGKVSRLQRAIVQGEYLTEAAETEILLGSRLAKTLEVELGDRVVLTAARAQDGKLAQELFRVSGIFEFGSHPLDQGLVFIPLKRAQDVLGLGVDVHEIAFRFRTLELANRDDLELWTRLANTGNEALNWKGLAPALRGVIDMVAYATWIVAGILFGVIIIGVINSLFMAIHERMFEFGVMKAVGTRPLRLVSLVLLEAAVLALISIMIGLVVGGSLTAYFSVHGFDFSGIEYTGTPLTDPIRTVPKLTQFIMFPLFVLILTLIAGLYPAIYAARIVPSQAMRKSL